MRETYANPELIEQDLPTNAIEQVNYELSRYPDGFRFRQRLMEVRETYQGAPLMNWMDECTHLRSQAVSHSVEKPDIDMLDATFSRGQWLAMHANLSHLHPNARQRALIANPLQRLRNAQMETSDHEEYIKGMFMYWEGSRRFEVFEEQTSAVKSALVEAATILYDDFDHDASYEEAFVSGYLFATLEIEDFARTTAPV